MSDYLSRAAQRAAPSAPVVRPALPSLFEREKPRPDPLLIDEETAAVPASERPAHRFEERTVLVSSTREAPAIRVPPASTPAAPVPRSFEEFATEPSPPLESSGPPESAASLKVAVEASAASPLPISQVPMITRAANGMLQRPPEQQLPSHEAASPRVPITILPRRARQKEGNAAAPRHSSPRHEEPPAIHVTIGRVEVRAVHPSPSTARGPSAPSPRISLDEYLRSRNKGAA